MVGKELAEPKKKSDELSLNEREKKLHLWYFLLIWSTIM